MDFRDLPQPRVTDAPSKTGNIPTSTPSSDYNEVASTETLNCHPPELKNDFTFHRSATAPEALDSWRDIG